MMTRSKNWVKAGVRAEYMSVSGFSDLPRDIRPQKTL